MEYLIALEVRETVYRSMGPVSRFFRLSGYELGVFRWNGTDCYADNSDYCFPHDGIYFGDLEANLIQLTPLYSLVDFFLNKRLEPKYYEMSDVRDFLDNNASKQPLFAFIHLLIPHTPHRFTTIELDIQSLRDLEKQTRKLSNCKQLP